MDLIQTVTVGSGGAANIEFGTGASIPQTYTDLLLVFSARVSVTDGGLRLRVNGSTANLSTRLLYGNGSTATSATDTTYLGSVPNSGWTANTFGNGSLYIPNYTSSVAKPFTADLVDENNGTTGIQWLTAGQFNSSSAITSLALFNAGGGNFVQHSSASLYGILKGSDGTTTVS
jgi:hypothetical protein